MPFAISIRLNNANDTAEQSEANPSHTSGYNHDRDSLMGNTVTDVISGTRILRISQSVPAN